MLRIKFLFQNLRYRFQVIRILWLIGKTSKIATSDIYILQLKLIFLFQSTCHLGNRLINTDTSCFGTAVQMNTNHFYSRNQGKFFKHMHKCTIFIRKSKTTAFSSTRCFARTHGFQVKVHTYTNFNYVIFRSYFLQPCNFPLCIQINDMSSFAGTPKTFFAFHRTIIYNLLISHVLRQLILIFGNYFCVTSLFLHILNDPWERVRLK